MARDRITVFDLQSSRDRVIHPLLEDLKLQSNIGRPDEVVRIEGRANVPGEYPLETGMTVRDLIRAGGGLSDSAFGGTAELTRSEVVNGETRRTQLIQVDLAVSAAQVIPPPTWRSSPSTLSASSRSRPGPKAEPSRCAGRLGSPAPTPSGRARP